MSTAENLFQSFVLRRSLLIISTTYARSTCQIEDIKSHALGGSLRFAVCRKIMILDVGVLLSFEYNNFNSTIRVKQLSCVLMHTKQKSFCPHIVYADVFHARH